MAIYFYIKDLITNKNITAIKNSITKSFRANVGNNDDITLFISGDETKKNISVVINDSIHLSRPFNFGHLPGSDILLLLSNNKIQLSLSINTHRSEPSHTHRCQPREV
jgi:hypothetical protein